MKPDIQQHATQFFFITIIIDRFDFRLREISRDLLASPLHKQSFKNEYITGIEK